VNKFHQAVFSDPTVPNGLNRSIDFRAVTLEHDRLLSNYRQSTARSGQSASSEIRTIPVRDSCGYAYPPHAASLTFSGHGTDAACEFRVKLLPLYVPRDVSDVRAF
jgi:hypothetical protein